MGAVAFLSAAACALSHSPADCAPSHRLALTAAFELPQMTAPAAPNRLGSTNSASNASVLSRYGQPCDVWWLPLHDANGNACGGASRGRGF